MTNDAMRKRETQDSVLLCFIPVFSPFWITYYFYNHTYLKLIPLADPMSPKQPRNPLRPAVCFLEKSQEPVLTQQQKHPSPFPDVY